MGGPVGRFQEAPLPTACRSSCKASRADPVRTGVGSLVWGTLRGSKGRGRLLALETGCGQGGVGARGPGLPERGERKAELWVLEEHWVGGLGAPAEPPLRARWRRSGEL